MGNETNLEGRIDKKIAEMELRDFIEYSGLNKPANLAEKYVRSLVGNLYASDGKYYSMGIRTVGDLYSISPDVIKRMRMYGPKTFLKLNSLLTSKGLPALQLPKEYTSSHQTSK